MEASVKKSIEVNTKGLLKHLFNQMEKLDKNEIDCKQACAQASLAKQVNNTLDYELHRAVVLMKLKEQGKQTEPILRDIEES